MKIKISNLTNGKYDYRFEDDVNEIDISEPYTGNYETEVILSKFDDQLILDAQTSINANLVCDRCNKSFRRKISSNYKMVYLLRITEYNDSSTDVCYLHPVTDSIEISTDVRDFALLAIPMKKLCKNDCRGLCASCGKDLNEGHCDCKREKVDARWQPLLDLKNKQNIN